MSKTIYYFNDKRELKKVVAPDDFTNIRIDEKHLLLAISDDTSGAFEVAPAQIELNEWERLLYCSDGIFDNSLFLLEKMQMEYFNNNRVINYVPPPVVDINVDIIYNTATSQPVVNISSNRIHDFQVGIILFKIGATLPQAGALYQSFYDVNGPSKQSIIQPIVKPANVLADWSDATLMIFLGTKGKQADTVCLRSTNIPTDPNVTQSASNVFNNYQLAKDSRFRKTPADVFGQNMFDLEGDGDGAMNLFNQKVDAFIPNCEQYFDMETYTGGEWQLAGYDVD